MLIFARDNTSLSELVDLATTTSSYISHSFIVGAKRGFPNAGDYLRLACAITPDYSYSAHTTYRISELLARNSIMFQIDERFSTLSDVALSFLALYSCKVIYENLDFA